MATWTRLRGRSAASTQTTTDSAPTGVEDGVNLDDVAGFTLWVECAAGQTFNGQTGSMDAYLYDFQIGRWGRAPELDVAVDAAWSGQRTVAIGFAVGNPRNRLAHIANGIPVTGGGLTVTYTCTDPKGNPN